jgi:hypothetical protein
MGWWSVAPVGALGPLLGPGVRAGLVSDPPSTSPRSGSRSPWPVAAGPTRSWSCRQHSIRLKAAAVSRQRPPPAAEARNARHDRYSLHFRKSPSPRVDSPFSAPGCTGGHSRAPCSDPSCAPGELDDCQRVRLGQQGLDRLESVDARIQHAHPGHPAVHRVRHERVERTEVVARVDDAAGCGTHGRPPEPRSKGGWADADVQAEDTRAVQPGRAIVVAVLVAASISWSKAVASEGFIATGSVMAFGARCSRARGWRS